MSTRGNRTAGSDGGIADPTSKRSQATRGGNKGEETLLIGTIAMDPKAGRIAEKDPQNTEQESEPTTNAAGPQSRKRKANDFKRTEVYIDPLIPLPRIAREEKAEGITRANIAD